MEKRLFTLVWIGKALTQFEEEFFLLSARSDQGETILFGGSEDCLKENVGSIRSCQLPVEIECECKPTGLNPPDEPLQWYVGPSYSFTIFQSKDPPSSVRQEERSDSLDLRNGRVSHTIYPAILSLISRLVLKIKAIIQRFRKDSCGANRVSSEILNQGAKTLSKESEAELEKSTATQLLIEKDACSQAAVGENDKAAWDKINHGEQSPSKQLTGISSTEDQPPPSPTSPQKVWGERDKYLDNPNLYKNSVPDFEDDAPG